eukprot:958535-Rhodomonas_salina.1
MDVPAFLADAIKPSELTKSMGAELFGTFSKNPPGIWSVSVQDGVEIEELSDGPPDLIASSSEDEENKVKPVIFPTMQPIKVEYVTEKGRTVMMLAWILATCFRLLNTARIKVSNQNSSRQLVFGLLLVITANISPLLVIWVAAGAYLGSCNQRGHRVTQRQIDEFYFPSTPEVPPEDLPDFKL